MIYTKVNEFAALSCAINNSVNNITIRMCNCKPFPETPPSIFKRRRALKPHSPTFFTPHNRPRFAEFRARNLYSPQQI